MEINPWYITGIVDGEGSFLVSFSRRDKLSVGVEVRPSFTVSQNKRSLSILEELRSYFDCGGIRFDSHDQTYKYEVRSLDDLKKKILPHFDKYPLRTSKKNDFEIFKEICRAMKANLHLSAEGIKEIIASAYTMNNIGARRYLKTDLLNIVGKMKV